MGKVIKSADGKVINIGDWDYQYDDEGTALNPMPDGAYEDTAEIVDDNGLHERTAWLAKKAADHLKKNRLRFSEKPGDRPGD